MVSWALVKRCVAWIRSQEDKEAPHREIQSFRKQENPVAVGLTILPLFGQEVLIERDTNADRSVAVAHHVLV